MRILRYPAALALVAVLVLAARRENPCEEPCYACLPGFLYSTAPATFSQPTFVRTIDLSARSVILPPGAEVNYRQAVELGYHDLDSACVILPDESIDYKLIVLNPNVPSLPDVWGLRYR